MEKVAVRPGRGGRQGAPALPQPAAACPGWGKRGRVVRTGASGRRWWHARKALRPPGDWQAVDPFLESAAFIDPAGTRRVDKQRFDGLRAAPLEVGGPIVWDQPEWSSKAARRSRSWGCRS